MGALILGHLIFCFSVWQNLTAWALGVKIDSELVPGSKPSHRESRLWRDAFRRQDEAILWLTGLLRYARNDTKCKWCQFLVSCF